ncbi:hypothetical protein ACOXN6_003627 [Shigella sonnei]
MISYIYMLLITIICYLWQGIAKEQVDFFKMASNNTSVSMKYDYLYTALVNADSLCKKGDCNSGKEIKLSNYKTSYEAKICQVRDSYYAFYTDSTLTQKPPVSLTTDSQISLFELKDVPIICKGATGTQTGTQSGHNNYALLKKN